MHDDHRHPHVHDHDHHGLHHHHHHGRNAPPASAVQWQTPHLPPGIQPDAPPRPVDFDLVEASFVEGFVRASDPTSFLRLAGIPFSGSDASGRLLHLLRCEIEDVTDVGSVVPLLGGEGMRYDPLPTKFVSHRRRLSFAYHDGTTLVRLDFAAARALSDRGGEAKIAAAGR